MSTFEAVCAQLESRIPGALRFYDRSLQSPKESASRNQEWSISQGVLTQICPSQGTPSSPFSVRLAVGQGGMLATAASEATPIHSFGRMTLLLSSLAQLTAEGRFCALVDASDSFDPVSAECAGVDLTRLLWVRCRKKGRLKPLEQAFKAADILVQNGGFGLIAVDLTGIEPRLLRKVPLSTWFRFARVVERMPTALLFLTEYPAAQSCAGLTLQLMPPLPCWSRAEDCDSDKIIELSTEDDLWNGISIVGKQQSSGEEERQQALGNIPGGKKLNREVHTQVLSELKFETQITRSKRKPVQPARSHISAKAVWR